MARLLLITCLFCFLPAALAQQASPPADEDGSSEQTEQSDDAFRRSRELEDARSRDQTFIDTNYGQPREQEKIDKLPEESRDNIRDQLIDVIVEEGDWEPADAMQDYPYTPTEAAEADPELKQQEQEAWDEQIAKYHEREANAWGAQRGPVPGPGNPTGQQGGQADSTGGNGQGGQQGSGGQGGDSGRTAGTYNPGAAGENGAEEENSTAGISESALDFLLGRQAASPAGGAAQQPAQPAGNGSLAATGQSDAGEPTAGQQGAPPAVTENSEEVAEDSGEGAGEEAAESTEVELDSRGIIAIRDLDKLEGAGSAPPEEEEDP